MKTLDSAITVFWILLGAALCFYAHDLGLSAPTGPDSGFFLMIAGVLLALSGVGVLVSIVTLRDTESEPFFQNSASMKRVCLVVIAVVLMIVLIPLLGFFAPGILVTPLLLRAVENRSWGFCIFVGAFSASAIVGLFSQVLGVPLPRGPFGF